MHSNKSKHFNYLKTRFLKQEFYTYCDNYLIAINPYNSLKIYRHNKISIYENKNTTNVDPQIYAISEASYRSLVETNKNQKIESNIPSEYSNSRDSSQKKNVQYHICFYNDFGLTYTNLFSMFSSFDMRVKTLG